jgi:hypothetical protein
LAEAPAAIEHRVLYEQQLGFNWPFTAEQGGLTRMKIVHSLLFLLAALLAASGVHAAQGSVPILNFEDLVVTSGDGKSLTVEQVKQAILVGASRARWAASVRSGNVIRLTYSPRTHVAVVDVTYSAKGYSIRYAESTNLNYGQEGGTAVIHPFYNKWINGLRQQIEVALRSV